MSIFKQMIQARDEVSKIVNRNVDFMNAIADSSLTNSDYVPISGDRTLHLSDGMLQVVSKMDEVVSECSLTDIGNFDLPVGDSDTFKTLVDQVAAGTDTYQLQAELLTKFVYSNRLSYSDVCNYLNNYSTSDITRIREDLFSVVNEEGYITRNTYLAVLKEWLNAGEDSVANNTYELDETNPYTLRTILNIAVAVISGVIEAICVMIGGIIGAIGYIITAVISAFTQVARSISEASVFQYDNTGSNTYVTGPPVAVDSTTQVAGDSEHTQHVCMHERNGIATFFWLRNKDNDQVWRVNSYIYPYYKPYLANMLKGLNWVSEGYSNYQFSVGNVLNFRKMYNNPAFSGNTNWYYTDTESPQTNTEALLSLAIGFVMNCLTVEATRLYLAGEIAKSYEIGISSANDHPYWYNASDSRTTTLWAALQAWRLYLANYDGSDSWLTDSTLTRILKEFASNLANLMKDRLIPNRDKLTGEASDYSDITYIVTDSSTSGKSFPVYKSIILADDELLEFSDSAIEFYINSNASGVIHSDCLPISWGITLPQVDLGALANALVLVGLIVTAAAISATLIKRAIRKRSIAKQALRANDVNEARKEYLEDPTNKAKRKAYTDLAYKYDTFGKWFGWGSYDAANGWVNAPTNSTVGENEILTDMRSKLGAQLSSTDDSLQALIVQVKNLIKA